MARDIWIKLVGLLIVFLLPVVIGQGCGSDPVEIDSDGDGFPDAVEVNSDPATNPYDPMDNPDNPIDSDGDGCTDYEELNFEGFCDNDPNTPPEDEPHETVSLSGSVGVAGTLLMDSDTADPNNVFTSNDTVAQAQLVPNPSTIGGYLGRTFDGFDVNDVFEVQMAAGQKVTLLLADMQANDFDLFLYDLEGTALDSSEGVGKAEQIIAPVNDTFLVEVYGYSIDDSSQHDEGGLYTLLIGEDLQVAGIQGVRRERLSSLDSFVPGEVLLRFGAADVSSNADGKDVTGRLQRMDQMENVLGYHRYQIKSLVSRSKGVQRQAKTFQATGLDRPTSAVIDTVKQLRREGRESVQPNYIRQIDVVPNDEFYQMQWHYEQIGLPEAWDTTIGSSQVIVAVIDTGVVLDHPDLQGQLVDGYDFISDETTSLDGDGLDSNPNDPGDSDNPSIPSSFHGTHVSGIIGARTNNSTGVAGTAWNVRIMPLRAMGKGGGTDYDIAQCILYAAGLENDSGTVPDEPADIINMSLGGSGYSRVEQEAITAARGQGIIIITAAGNRSQNGDNDSPGGLDGVFNVSAVDYTRTQAPYSNFGDSIAVAAPGGNSLLDANGDGFPDGVLSAVGDKDGGVLYEFYEGTSMAAPHVAGVAALMKAVYPDLNPQDFELLLAGEHPDTTVQIVDDLGAEGRDQLYGYGLINALKAVRAAGQISDTPPLETPILRVVPRDLDFGQQPSVYEIDVQNGGNGTLVVDEVTTEQSWISVDPQSGGVGSYTVSVDREGLEDGYYASRDVS